MDKCWWKESVVYQIYPRSFRDSNGDGIGDLNGITEKLDYLEELGIDVIWLSPIYQSPNDDNGYDISDYQAIMKEFGTMEDFDRMLLAIHEHGMKLMMDLVVNHTSDEHQWFVKSRKSTDNPYRDYYIWRPGKDGGYPNNWGSYFSGPAWEYDETTDMYYLHLFSKKQPDLNWDNPEVRQNVFSMMNWWLDKGIDGFRMDVISLISKDPALPDGVPGFNGFAEPACANGPHVHDYLQQMRREVLNRADTITVGECAGVTLEEAKKYSSSDGKELNMVFQFEHTEVDTDPEIGKWSRTRMDLVKYKSIMTRWEKGLQDIGWNSLFFENHDQPRSVSRYGDEGEYRELSAKMLATCLHMMQGTPYVYQGEELGMTNVPFASIEDFRDLESINAYHELTGQGKYTEEEMLDVLRYRSRDNARTPMQWDDSRNAGFTDGVPWIGVNPNYTEINAKEEIGREDSVFHYYQKLIRLRHEKEIIVYGSYDILYEKDEELYVYTRSWKGEQLLIACNFSAHEREIQLPEAFQNSCVLIQNYPDPVKRSADGSLPLRAYEAVVFDERA